MLTDDKIYRFDKKISNFSEEELNKVLSIGNQIEELLINETFQKFINNVSHNKIVRNYDRVLSDIGSSKVLIKNYLKRK